MKEEGKNPFKKIETYEEVSSGLKEKVMTSIHFAHLVGELSDLFTAKMGGTASKLVLIEKDTSTNERSADLD